MLPLWPVRPKAEEQCVNLVLWLGAEEKIAGLKNRGNLQASDLEKKLEESLPVELVDKIDIVVLDPASRSSHESLQPRLKGGLSEVCGSLDQLDRPEWAGCVDPDIAIAGGCKGKGRHGEFIVSVLSPSPSAYPPDFRCCPRWRSGWGMNPKPSRPFFADQLGQPRSKGQPFIQRKIPKTGKAPNKRQSIQKQGSRVQHVAGRSDKSKPSGEGLSRGGVEGVSPSRTKFLRPRGTRGCKNNSE